MYEPEIIVFLFLGITVNLAQRMSQTVLNLYLIPPTVDIAHSSKIVVDVHFRICSRPKSTGGTFLELGIIRPDVHHRRHATGRGWRWSVRSWLATCSARNIRWARLAHRKFAGLDRWHAGTQEAKSEWRKLVERPIKPDWSIGSFIGQCKPSIDTNSSAV